jgi:hypothetical protein
MLCPNKKADFVANGIPTFPVGRAGGVAGHPLLAGVEDSFDQL